MVQLSDIEAARARNAPEPELVLTRQPHTNGSDLSPFNLFYLLREQMDTVFEDLKNHAKNDGAVRSTAVSEVVDRIHVPASHLLFGTPASQDCETPLSRTILRRLRENPFALNSFSPSPGGALTQPLAIYRRPSSAQGQPSPLSRFNDNQSPTPSGALATTMYPCDVVLSTKTSGSPTESQINLDGKKDDANGNNGTGAAAHHSEAGGLAKGVVADSIPKEDLADEPHGDLEGIKEEAIGPQAFDSVSIPGRFTFKASLVFSHSA
ncbi:hypothetical protein P7C73_g1369, partial [Tremellales sp. Uapishka_1]